jgi:predicted nucleotide-binding protein
MSQATPEKPGTWRARVFLAYASEDGDVALAVKGAIENYAKIKAKGKVLVIPWEVNNELTRSILDNVRDAMKEREFGVFIYSPVDGKARDNVVFESSLFIGMKGVDRAIILLPENRKVAPSDLDGILGLNYPYSELRATEEHLARVGILGEIGAVIVDRINAIIALPPRVKSSRIRNSRNRVRGVSNLQRQRKRSAGD